MGKDLAIPVIIAAADLMVLVAMGAPESEWLPVIERLAEYKSALNSALNAEKVERECNEVAAPTTGAVLHFGDLRRRVAVSERWRVDVSEYIGGKWVLLRVSDFEEFEAAKRFALETVNNTDVSVRIDAVDNASGQIGEAMEKIRAINDDPAGRLGLPWRSSTEGS